MYIPNTTTSMEQWRLQEIGKRSDAGNGGKYTVLSRNAIGMAKHLACAITTLENYGGTGTIESTLFNRIDQRPEIFLGVAIICVTC